MTDFPPPQPLMNVATAAYGLLNKTDNRFTVDAQSEARARLFADIRHNILNEQEEIEGRLKEIDRRNRLK